MQVHGRQTPSKTQTDEWTNGQTDAGNNLGAF